MKPQVYDGFLDQHSLEAIKATLRYPEFWTYCPNKVIEGNEDFRDHMFIHEYYSLGKKQSKYFDLVVPVFKKLLPLGIYRVKANLETFAGEKPFKSEFHWDFVSDYGKNPAKNLETAIFYVHSCNGYTEFEDGTVVHSVENRLVRFSGDIKHRGVAHTDSRYRHVINFGYIMPELDKSRSI